MPLPTNNQLFELLENMSVGGGIAVAACVALIGFLLWCFILKDL